MGKISSWQRNLSKESAEISLGDIGVNTNELAYLIGITFLSDAYHQMQKVSALDNDLQTLFCLSLDDDSIISSLERKEKWGNIQAKLNLHSGSPIRMYEYHLAEACLALTHLKIVMPSFLSHGLYNLIEGTYKALTELYKCNLSVRTIYSVGGKMMLSKYQSHILRISLPMILNHKINAQERFGNLEKIWDYFSESDLETVIFHLNILR